MLQPKAVVMSLSGLLSRTMSGPIVLLQLGVVFIIMVCAPTGCKDARAANRQLRKRDMGGLCDNPNPLPSKKGGLNKKPLKRTLQNLLRMLRNTSPQLIASGWDAEGEDSVLFTGQATESLTKLQCVYRQHKLNFFNFYFVTGLSPGLI